MATMTDDPYVNHVPVMTGGVGREAVARFYDTYFIGHWPADIEVIPVSRTAGEDQVVDELVLRFTHDIEMPALLPGVAPTGTPGRARVRGRRRLPRRQDHARAHLLGPGLPACAGRAARRRHAARRRCRACAEGARPIAAGERPDRARRALAGLVRLARELVAAYGRHQVSQHAAAIAYRVMFSLVPFVALVVSVADLVLPAGRREQFVDWVLRRLARERAREQRRPGTGRVGQRRCPWWGCSRSHCCSGARAA